MKAKIVTFAFSFSLGGCANKAIDSDTMHDLLKNRIAQEGCLELIEFKSFDSKTDSSSATTVVAAARIREVPTCWWEQNKEDKYVTFSAKRSSVPADDRTWVVDLTLTFEDYEKGARLTRYSIERVSR